METNFIESFAANELLLISNTSDKPFHYASGGVGPYYIDLRRGPNDPQMFNTFLDKYSSNIEGTTDNLLFVGVPTTGVVFATGLSVRYSKPLAVIEKNNPEIVHIFSSNTIQNEVNKISGLIENFDKCAFLGLEDMGVVLSTALGLQYDRPSAIMRRVPKGHGTSKTIEANLDLLYKQGVTHLYIINDFCHPQDQDEIFATLKTIKGVDRFTCKVIDQPPLKEEPYTCVEGKRVIEVEDLWTTGTSAINLHSSIKKTLGATAEVLVFLDREQHAMQKFNSLNINAKSVCRITEVANHLYKQGMVNSHTYNKVVDYVGQFKTKSYMEKLEDVNKSCVCVGLDITPGKFPSKPEDTTLPNYPYANNAEGVNQYCMDLLNEIAKVPEIKVIKPNLAYYNSLTNQGMHKIIHNILQKAKQLGLLVILDTKIGDIMRTQSQYAEKYKNFDAVTAHGYMGSDSIFPITDAQIGCYVLVFTSNPSRVDLETQPLLDSDVIEEYTKFINMGVSYEQAKTQAIIRAKKVYHKMAEHVVDWQFAGSVGAVVGGTPNKDGKLVELDEIVGIFADKLGYIPPLLIPGVGTQGGSATDVMNAIMTTLDNRGWSEQKIRKELTKVLINSSSSIDYSPRPKDAAQDLVEEIQNAINGFFK